MEFDTSLASHDQWQSQLSLLRAKILATSRDESVRRAENTERFLLYRELTTIKVEFGAYFGKNLDNKSKLIDLRWFFRLRGELVNLGSVPWLDSEEDKRLCTLCTFGVREDLFHFLAECPRLSELLSSLDYHPLVKFSRKAWSRRIKILKGDDSSIQNF